MPLSRVTNNKRNTNLVVSVFESVSAFLCFENPFAPGGCLTRLDHNRALGQVAEKAKVAVTDVKNVIIWGNHSSSQYPDVNHGTVKGKPIREVIGDDEYLNNEFIQVVQQRGAAIIKVSLPV